ncbi:MAG: ribonuclease III [Chiayiivirga sp.]|uniref:ribonuclease III n=1 Tax=Chiayiivirga sp. TaxID=2041042 RepID=UPI0025C2C300|nr:ribonuclease III [Chiayiivirga sp.]MCI1709406.1 ribonuclease III [Chiayiivirga sp.]MCI1730296.1 ribonuclease III [Chiayiivirga sp.]
MSTDLIRHAFADPTLLQRALTHRSAGSRNNERLEFLGDALVNLIVAEALYQRWPRADEGELTRARAQLVRESSLAGLARDLELGDRLDLGPGELKSGGFRRDSILADAFEALVAAIYLDAGFEACRERVLAWFRGLIEGLTPGRTEKDAKTRLQEWLQARQLPLPEYRVIAAEGEDHHKTFHVQAVLANPALDCDGQGSSRRLAEQVAAQGLLLELEKWHERR